MAGFAAVRTASRRMGALKRAYAAGPVAQVLVDMESRGMVSATTSPSIYKEAGTLTVYAGFDPTASSLHVGNLLVIKSLVHFAARGHKVIGLVGGATGLVGDPTGRKTERAPLNPNEVKLNAQSIATQLAAVVDRGVVNAKRHLNIQVPTVPIECINNADFYSSMSVLDFVQDVGRHARVSAMLARDSVKGRLASPEGLSFAELMYQLFQAHDFYCLYKRHGCRVQLGGSDQWGNITAGIDLIHRHTHEDVQAKPAYGLTLPLITDAHGEKFGKSAGNAVWLDAARTTPYDLFQFFLNTSDDEALRLLRLLTFVDIATVDRIGTSMAGNAQAREAQHLLAKEVVEMVHGPEAAHGAHAATSLLFGPDSHALKSLSRDRLDVLRYAPYVSLSRRAVLAMSATSLAVASGLCPSKSEAARLIQRKSLYLNGAPVESTGAPAGGDEQFLAGEWLVLRSGKKHYRVVRISQAEL